MLSYTVKPFLFYECCLSVFLSFFFEANEHRFHIPCVSIFRYFTSVVHSNYTTADWLLICIKGGVLKKEPCHSTHDVRSTLYTKGTYITEQLCVNVRAVYMTTEKSGQTFQENLLYCKHTFKPQSPACTWPCYRRDVLCIVLLAKTSCGIVSIHIYSLGISHVIYTCIFGTVHTVVYILHVTVRTMSPWWHQTIRSIWNALLWTSSQTPTGI